jgi:hypothetical protein
MCALNASTRAASTPTLTDRAHAASGDDTLTEGTGGAISQEEDVFVVDDETRILH